MLTHDDLFDHVTCNPSETVIVPHRITKLVHWPLMGGRLHLVQWRGAWAGHQPAQASPHCTKGNSLPINGQSTYHQWSVAVPFWCAREGLKCRCRGRQVVNPNQVWLVCKCEQTHIHTNRRHWKHYSTVDVGNDSRLERVNIWINYAQLQQDVNNVWKSTGIQLYLLEIFT